MAGQQAVELSIIVPTHNRAAWLPESIASVMGQDAPSFEAIYVDDASTDETAEILRKHAAQHGRRFRVVRGPGKGPGPARNAGVREARGRLILFGDDDAVAPPHWARMAMEQREKAQADVLAYAFTPHAMQTRAERYQYYRYLLVTGQRITWDYVGPVLFLMPRTLFESVGGFPEAAMAAAEDYALCYRLRSANARILFDPHVSVVHRFSPRLDGVMARVKAAAKDGGQFYLEQGAGRIGLTVRAAAKCLTSPCWSLMYYPLDLWPLSLRMEWLFFRERVRTVWTLDNRQQTME